MNHNAPRPLRIGHEEGHVQLVHPDVLHVPGGFGGYPYWMAFTPYPFGDDRAENPVVRASRDGYHWERPEGVADPLVAAPSDPDVHHADTELAFDGGRLHLLYMTTRKSTGESTFSVLESGDGRNWSAPRVFQSGWQEVSPTVVVGRDGLWLWAVERLRGQGPASFRLVLRRGADLFHLGPAEPCTVELPGYEPWHVDVVATAGGYEALLAAFPAGTDNSHTRLFALASPDGRAFRPLPPVPLLGPSRWGWDNRMIYRSTFLKDPGGHYRIWYSAASWRWRFGVGYLEGTRGELAPSPRAETVRPPFWTDLLPAGSRWARYHLKRRLPPAPRRALRALLKRDPPSRP